MNFHFNESIFCGYPFGAATNKQHFPLRQTFPKRMVFIWLCEFWGLKNTGSDNGNWKRFAMKSLVLREGFQKPSKSPRQLNDCRKYAEKEVPGALVHLHCDFFDVRSLKYRSAFQKK